MMLRLTNLKYTVRTCLNLDQKFTYFTEMAKNVIKRLFPRLDKIKEDKILKILEKPYDEQKEINDYQLPSSSNEKYQTFCGT